MDSKTGAAHAGATVMGLNPKGHFSGQGRNGECSAVLLSSKPRCGTARPSGSDASRQRVAVVAGHGAVLPGCLAGFRQRPAAASQCPAARGPLQVGMPPAIQTRKLASGAHRDRPPIAPSPLDAVVDDDVRRPVPALPLAMPPVPPISCRDEKPSLGTGPDGDGFSYSARTDR